jgi:CelD/BcsL family acetyltransferase involved in cellulose biosynthesis
VYEIALEHAFSFLSDEYAALFRLSCATAFQHPLWLDRLYGRLASAVGAEPLVITARTTADRRLAMVLPLVRCRRGTMRMIEFADLRVSDYAAPVCDAVTFELILRDKAACDALRKLLKPYDLLRIRKLGETALPLERLFGTRPRSPLGMSAHAVKLYGPYAEWRNASIDPSYRKELDKKHRQLLRKGDVRFEVSRHPETIKAAFQAMRHYRESRFRDDLLQKDLYFAFYLEMALQGANSGFSRTYVLSVDGRPIAVAWGLAFRHQFLVLMGGFDLATFKSQSIGALTFSEIARDCIERGDTALDFTIGDESYKSLFGAQPTSMWMISAAGSPLGSLVNVIAARMPGTLKLAKEIVNRRTSGSTALAGRA